MTSDASLFGEILILTGDRYPDLWNEIGRGEYRPDLDERLKRLAKDLENKLSEHQALTPKRKARLEELPRLLQEARSLDPSPPDYQTKLAFQRAAHCINDVVVDVTHGHVLE